MSPPAHVFRGRCHCGNLEIRLETDKPAAELQTRTCRCGFCTRHGARTVTDADGNAFIKLINPEKINFYRFGLHTADYLICAECGVYGAAVTEHEGRMLATFNINLFEGCQAFPPPTPVDYEGENEAERRARRATRWTPARLMRGS